MGKIGWKKGIEPSTSRSTICRSTAELLPPLWKALRLHCNFNMQDYINKQEKLSTAFGIKKLKYLNQQRISQSNSLQSRQLSLVCFIDNFLPTILHLCSFYTGKTTFDDCNNIGPNKTLVREISYEAFFVNSRIEIRIIVPGR